MHAYCLSVALHAKFIGIFSATCVAVFIAIHWNALSKIRDKSLSTRWILTDCISFVWLKRCTHVRCHVLVTIDLLCSSLYAKNNVMSPRMFIAAPVQYAVKFGTIK